VNTVDEIVKKAGKAAEFVRSCFQAVGTVLKSARVPPGRIRVTAEQATINYKAVAVSIILLFLARALEGIRVNDIGGSLFVVAIFVGLVLVLQYGSAGLARLARLANANKPAATLEDASKQWFSLLIAMWTWSLFLVVLHGLAHNYFRMVHWNLFFGTDFFIPAIGSIIALLIVAIKTKYMDKLNLEHGRVRFFYSIFSVGFITLALWVTIFKRWA
jgi:hypothetical protein